MNEFVRRLNPTELPTGKRYEQIVELRLPSVLPFDMVRLHRTGDGFDGPLGKDQLAGVDITLRDGADSTYIYTDLSGIPLPFPKPEAKPGAQSQNNGRKELRLEPLPRSGFRVWERNIKQDFALYPGRIWRIDRIVDQHGNTICFERDRNGLLLNITLADDLKLEFQNDQRGFRQGYDLVAPTGERLEIMRYQYDASGRLVVADNSVGPSQTYVYDDGRQLIQTIDDLANVTSHFYDDQGRVIRVENDSGYHNGQFSYHDARSQVTVAHGNGQEFEKLWFDADGRHFMAADAHGGFSYRTYDADNQLIAETDPNGHKTRYRNDPMGNPEAHIDAEGRERFMIWDDNGNLLVEKDPAGNTWRFRYGDNGTLEQSQSPSGHITNFRYDARGRLIQRMRHDGLIEFNSYDAHGRLKSHIDYNSAETKMSYDCFGRAASVTDALGNITSFEHDDTIEGKPFHMPSAVTRSDGSTIRRMFLASGDLASITDGDGRKTTYEYGPYNVIQGIQNARGNTLRFQYDSRKRLVCVTNETGRHWRFIRDDVGRVISETDFDGRTIEYTYDAGGRMTRRYNPDGAHVSYIYDKAGLLLERRAQAADGSPPLVSEFAYDDAGELIGAKNADATISLERDELGTVVAETVNDVTIQSEFDCCGYRVARHFDDTTFACRFDGMGGLTEWALDGHRKLTLSRDALGREIKRQSPDGFELRQRWDSVDQLTAQTANDNIARAIRWTKDFGPSEIVDENAGTKRFDYDPNGQIEQIRHGDGNVERFSYAANLTISATADDSKFMNWQTTASGVVKIAHGPDGEVITLEHDENGRVSQRTVTRKGFRPQTWRFSWNALDQLARAVCPDGKVWTYRYDPFGRRVTKETADTRITFVWDGDVVTREITHTNGGTQTVDWFYEPDSFRPLARLENGVLSYVITDYLGTPKELVGTDGTLHWRTDHAAWGALRPVRKNPLSGAKNAVADDGDYWIGEATRGAAQGVAYDAAYRPADAPDPTFCPIRFQGQWEDAETGLFYNRHRYYDPLIGSYTSPDPIGVNGGPRPDAYVIWPHLLTDPFGLNPCCAAKYRRNRPCFRNGVVESVWNAAVEEAVEAGQDYILDVGQRRIPIDSWTPGTGQSRVGVWDMGHLPGHEYRRQLVRLENGDITPDEFRDIYNNSANYRVEHPTTNRSHEHEEPDNCSR